MTTKAPYWIGWFMSAGVLVGGTACSPGSQSEVGGAGAAPASTTSPPAEAAPAEETVRGTLRHFDLEGGFWGIVSDAGERLRVVGPAGATWRDGTRVVARVRRLPPGPSLQQWGEPVEVVNLVAAPPTTERRRE